jgi:hypothetical protein
MVSKVIGVFISVKIGISEGIVVGLFEKYAAVALGLTPRHFVRDPLFAFGGKRVICFGLPSLSLAKRGSTSEAMSG